MCRVVAAACVILAGTVAAQGQGAPDPLVKENATVKLADHTYVIPDGNVGGVPNVGIIVGNRATLVIDPGLGRRNGETVLREMTKVSTNTELYVATTHFHPEHTTGYVAFPTAKYINSKVQEAEFAESGPQMIQSFASRTPVMGELLKDAQTRKADVTFDREYTLDLGGVRVKFLVVGPTHTRGDTGLFVEGDNVLFSGDVVMKDSFLAASQVSSMRAWLAAFDSFEMMHPRTIVPSHGPIGDSSLIPANRAIMQGIQARVRELKAQGRSADDAATTVQKEFQTKFPPIYQAKGGAFGGAASSSRKITRSGAVLFSLLATDPYFRHVASLGELMLKRSIRTGGAFARRNSSCSRGSDIPLRPIWVAWARAVIGLIFQRKLFTAPLTSPSSTRNTPSRVRPV